MGRTRVTGDKIMSELVKLAEEQEWVVEKAGNSHIKWHPPLSTSDEETVTTGANTPSMPALAKIKKDLEARGLITNRAEWRRAKARARQITRQVEEVFGGTSYPQQRDLADRRKLIAKAIRASEPWRFDGWDVETVLDNCRPVTIYALNHLITDEGRIAMACVCGREFPYPIGLIHHVGRCDKILYPEPPAPDPDPTPSQEDTPSVDRNLRDPIPERDRWNCPDCSFIAWQTQRDLIDSHMAAEHGKLPCPYCGRYYAKTKGGHTNHVRKCTFQPGGVDFRLPIVAPIAPPADEPVSNGGTVDLPEREHVCVWRPEKQETRLATPTDEFLVTTEFICVGRVGEDGCGSRVDEAMIWLNPDLLTTSNLQRWTEAKAAYEVTLWEAVPVPVDLPAPEAVVVEPPAAASPARRDQTTSTPIEPTDDELWALMELVLDGQVVPINRANLVIVNEWMDATRKLMALAAKS